MEALVARLPVQVPLASPGLPWSPLASPGLPWPPLAAPGLPWTPPRLPWPAFLHSAIGPLVALVAQGGRGHLRARGRLGQIETRCAVLQYRILLDRKSK